MRVLANVTVFIAVGLAIVCSFVAMQRHSAPPQAGSVPQPKNIVRRLEVKLVQDQLLRMGFDVQVSFIEEDDSRMLVYGKPVNRPFVYNLMARKDFRKMLRDGKFTEVTFMDSLKYPDFVQIYVIKQFGFELQNPQ
jgi:hypothetical protein